MAALLHRLILCLLVFVSTIICSNATTDQIDVGAYSPWNIPLDKISNEQKIATPPVAELSAIEMIPSQEIISLVIGGTAFIITVLVVGISVYCSKRNHAAHIESLNSSASSNGDQISLVLSVNTSPVVFSRHMTGVCTSTKCKVSPNNATLYMVAELQSAINSCCEEIFLGEGSLSSVCNAEFPNSQVVQNIYVVRKTDVVLLSFHEAEQFLDVVHSVSCLKHPNTACLVGYCVENKQQILVYFMRYLTLAKAPHYKLFLSFTLDIPIQISVGMARAPPYIHPLSPSMAHYSLSILRPLTSSSVKARASEMAISKCGYIPQKHGQSGIESIKTDVSGVLLLQLSTGRRPFDRSSTIEELCLGFAINYLADSPPLPNQAPMHGGEIGSSSDAEPSSTKNFDESGSVQQGMQKGMQEAVSPGEAQVEEESILIPIYERYSNIRRLRSQFSLDSSTSGYYSFAQRVKSLYPPPGIRAETEAVRSTLAHVLWPWYPHYPIMKYFTQDNIELNPLTMKWEDFKESLHYAHVEQVPRINYTDDDYDDATAAAIRERESSAVHLLLCGDQGVEKVMYIPKEMITSCRVLDHIIYLYMCSYNQQEPNDGLVHFLMTPWFGHWVWYKDTENVTLTRPIYFRPKTPIADDSGQHELRDENWAIFVDRLKFIELQPMER